MNFLNTLSIKKVKDKLKEKGLTEGQEKLLDEVTEKYENPVTTVTDGIGLTNYEGQEKALENAQQTLTGLMGQSDQVYQQILDAFSTKDADGNVVSTAIDDYKKAIGEFNPESFGTDLSAIADYSYGKNVADFLNPAAQYTIDNSVKAVQNAMAGQGGLSGGAAAAQLQAVASEAASGEYDKAYERLLQDQQIDYGKVKDLLNAEQQNNATRLSAETAKMSNMQGLSNSTIDTMLSALETDSNLKQALAQMGIDAANRPGVISTILGALGDGAQVYSAFNGGK